MEDRTAGITALILDATQEQALVLLYHDHKMDYLISDAGGRRHTPFLLQAIDTLLGRAGICAAQVTHVAAVVGPGSFTGIRVGVASAEGFAEACGAKRVAITSLEPYAEGDCVVTLDCKHGNFYCLKRCGGKDEYLNLSGDEPASYGLRVIPVSHSDPEKLLSTFLQKVEAGAYEQRLTPFYLKASSAERAQ